MTDEGRKAFLSAWQSKKQETIKHPFLDEKIEWGMAPYVQSMLLARYLRGDLDEYPNDNIALTLSKGGLLFLP